MSDQSESSVQSLQTSKDLRQRILDQLTANIAVIEELNDEELETVGGAGVTGLLKDAHQVFEKKQGWNYMSGAALSTMAPQLLSASVLL